MDFGITEDQREIQRTARSLLAERAKPERVREHAEARTVDEQLWLELCELGWPGIAVSERHGGGGLGSVELCILCEELGRALAPVPFLPTVMAASAIEHAGSAEQQERWLPGLASGEIRGALGACVDGTAELVIGAPDAAVIVLLERDGSAQLLAGSDAELSPLASIDPTRSAARVSVRGDAQELPGDVAGGVDRALVAASSELVGVCDRALEMTVAYVKERRQFGVPVGSYQAVSHRCAQMLLEVEGARSLSYWAGWALDNDPASAGRAASMAKAYAGDAGFRVTASALQVHGGIGFTWEHDLHFFLKRAKANAHAFGDARWHRDRVADLAGI